MLRREDEIGLLAELDSIKFDLRTIARFPVPRTMEEKEINKRESQIKALDTRKEEIKKILARKSLTSEE